MSLVEKLIYRFVSSHAWKYGITEEDAQGFSSTCFSLRKRLYRAFLSLAYDPIKERATSRRNAVLSLPDSVAAFYREELAFIKNGYWGVFPYPAVCDVASFEFGKDSSTGLPYVVHKGKHLYFPKSYSPQQSAEAYRYYVGTECILSDKYLAKTPHAYQTDNFKVEKGDIVLDIGCSEGLFALDTIETAGKTYVFEAQKIWKKPNLSTFASFGEKVTVVNKFVGAKTTNDSVCLNDVLSSENSAAHYFLKMDIEGGEGIVLKSCSEFLCTHKVKIACAAYHRQKDADDLSRQLKEMGFSVSFSEGYMLPQMHDFEFPYFRRGMIYATNC